MLRPRRDQDNPEHRSASERNRCRGRPKACIQPGRRTHPCYACDSKSADMTRPAHTVGKEAASGRSRRRTTASSTSMLVPPGPETEALLRSTLDSLSAHIAVLDGTGMIIAVNEAWR